MRLRLPNKVIYILDILKRHGFEAYAVGGCVRDSILARKPDDWDITTSATPQEVKSCFRRTIDTGIEHGTVTVMLEDDGFEVTTYRLDGEYTDGRHPDKVTFTPNLVDDLMRRDFTINAMAYNPDAGLVDLYGGMRDLQRKVIRCVGNPDERFEEDALRVMRAVRFAAQLGFTIEPATREAMRRHAPQLKKISAERIRIELMKLLASPHPEKVWDLYELGITAVIMPEFDRCMETAQNTKHHMYTVGEHTIRALCEIPSDPMLRLTMLLHDIAKPECRKTDVDGVDHFKGHAEASAVMADNILRRLKFDNDTRKEVVNLIRWHDLRPKPEDAAVRKAAYAVGPAHFPSYLDIQMADNLAKSEYKRDEKLKQIKDVAAVYARILRHGDCLSLKDLAIGGADLLAMGYNGPVVGKTLHAALMEVLEHPEKNRIDDLLAFAREYAESESGAESGFESGSKSGSESESGLRGETDSADDPGNKKDAAGADASRAASLDKGGDMPSGESSGDKKSTTRAASSDKGGDMSSGESSGDKKSTTRAASSGKGKDTSGATSRRSGNAEASGKSSGRKKAGSRAGSGSAAGKPRKGGK